MSALGPLFDDPISSILGTSFHRFAAPSGCHGLVDVHGDAIQILAVASSRERRGQFRQFIKDCKSEYTSIEVLEIWEPIVKDALARYGFEPFEKTRDDGERVTGMRWVKVNAPQA